MIVVADPSGLLAVFDRADPEHFAARRAADAASALVVSPPALTEVHHVASVRAGRRVGDAILGCLADTRIVLADTDSDHLRTALTVRETYADLDLDLVDAVCVAVADRFDTDAVLTLDRRDFRAIRSLRRFSAFRLFPDDLAG